MTSPAIPRPDEPLFDKLVAASLLRGRFVLASGAVSDVYLDCRRTTLSADGIVLVGEALHRHHLTVCPEVVAVAGPTLGADPLVAAFAYASALAGAPKHAMMVRKAAKEHGTGSRIEGTSNVPAGAPVLALEDVVTSGGSLVDAVEALQAEGYVVEHALVLVDRGAGAREALGARGVTLHALFTMDQLLGGS